MRAVLAFLAFASAFALAGANARASSQVWCSLSVRSIAPQNTQGQPDNVYVLTLQNENALAVTRAKISVMDDERIYEIAVPVREPVAHDGLSVYEPVAIHYAKPTTVRTAWITQISDDEGHTADCYPVARNAQAPANGDRSASARLDASPGDGLPFITPDACKQRYVDAQPVDLVVPVFPAVAKETMNGGSATVLVRVDIAQSGQIVDAHVLSSAGVPSLDSATLEAAVQTTYRPKKVNCIPFASTYTFRATFAPNNY